MKTASENIVRVIAYPSSFKDGWAVNMTFLITPSGSSKTEFCFGETVRSKNGLNLYCEKARREAVLSGVGCTHREFDRIETELRHAYKQANAKGRRFHRRKKWITVKLPLLIAAVPLVTFGVLALSPPVRSLVHGAWAGMAAAVGGTAGDYSLAVIGTAVTWITGAALAFEASCRLHRQAQRVIMAKRGVRIQ